MTEAGPMTLPIHTLTQQLREASCAQDAADLAARWCAESAGYSAALLTIATEAGGCVGCHGLTDAEVAHFRRNTIRASLAERKRNRGRLLERAWPGTGITFVPQSNRSFHIQPSPESRLAGGTWQPLDSLFIQVPGADSSNIGVLSLDAPLDGMAPDGPSEALLAVERELTIIGPQLHARLLLQERQTTHSLLQKSQRFEPLGELLAEVTHDLNNLLMIINMSTEVIDGIDTTTAMAMIRDAVRRCGVLTDRLLKTSLAAPRSHLDISEVIAQLTPILTPLVRATGAELVAELHPTPLLVACPEESLGQILLNLVVNASKAAPKSRVLMKTAPLVEHGLRFAVLTVSDDGVGMTGDIQARIFEPHFTTRPDGSGIGLATVQRIVAQHQGRIRLTSQPGEGSSFRIELPEVIATAPKP